MTEKNMKELRIGNWFIEKDEIKQFDGDFYHLIDCQFIEVDPEWLVKFGFAYQHKRSEHFIQQYFIKEIANNNGNKKHIEITILESGHSEVTKFEIILIHEYRWGEIKDGRIFWSNELNIHTLQNLVFVLSGNELEIK